MGQKFLVSKIFMQISKVISAWMLYNFQLIYFVTLDFVERSLRIP